MKLPFLLSFIFLTMCLFTFSNFAAATKADLGETVYTNFEREKFEEIMHQVIDKVVKVKDKDIVLFIGTTGAGKSTSINYFQSIPLKAVKKGLRQIIEIDGTVAESARIGSTYTAETMFPSLYWNTELGSYLADCPGFYDNRGTEHEILTALGNYLAVRYAGAVKAIVVFVPVTAFTVDRGQGIDSVLEMLNQFIPDYHMVPSKIVFAFTHASEDEEKEDILEEIDLIELSNN